MSIPGWPTAAICLALLDGRFRSAGELARAAEVTAPTSSEHLGKLLAGRIVLDARQGRHRYFRLAGPDVAAALEALGILAGTAPVRSLRQANASQRLRAGRTCYDHLAGRLGVTLTDALIATGVLTTDHSVADLTPPGPTAPGPRSARQAASGPPLPGLDRTPLPHRRTPTRRSHQPAAPPRMGHPNRHWSRRPPHRPRTPSPRSAPPATVREPRQLKPRSSRLFVAREWRAGQSRVGARRSSSCGTWPGGTRAVIHRSVRPAVSIAVW